MSRTMTIKKGGGTDFSQGWKTVTIANAKYGDYNGTQYLDLWFEGYPETFNARIYATKGSNGEEFAIGQVFRFANAGITGGLEGPEDGEYTRVLKQFAPTVFANDVESFQEKDVDYWKGSAERYYNNYIANKSSSNGFVSDGPKDATEEAAEIF